MCKTIFAIFSKTIFSAIHIRDQSNGTRMETSSCVTIQLMISTHQWKAEIMLDATLLLTQITKKPKKASFVTTSLMCTVKHDHAKHLALHTATHVSCDQSMCGVPFSLHLHPHLEHGALSSGWPIQTADHPNTSCASLTQ